MLDPDHPKRNFGALLFVTSGQLVVTSGQLARKRPRHAKRTGLSTGSSTGFPQCIQRLSNAFSGEPKSNSRWLTTPVVLVFAMRQNLTLAWLGELMIDKFGFALL